MVFDISLIECAQKSFVCKQLKVLLSTVVETLGAAIA